MSLGSIERFLGVYQASFVKENALFWGFSPKVDFFALFWGFGANS